MRDKEQLAQFLGSFKFDIRDNKQNKHYFADGEDVTEWIRTAEVNKKVSEVSAHPSVRSLLVTLQREFGKEKNVVFEGRDMGTVVFPQAEVKIFLTARPAVRAERRYLEFKNKGVTTTQEEVFQGLLDRDHLDSTREISPLKQPEDAHVIDTSDLTIDQVINQILAIIHV